MVVGKNLRNAAYINHRQYYRHGDFQSFAIATELPGRFETKVKQCVERIAAFGMDGQLVCIPKFGLSYCRLPIGSVGTILLPSIL